MKRDSFWFPFEPNRWLSNEKLGMVSLEARGLWIHLICLIYKANAEGKLLIGGNIPTTEQISRSVGDDCGVALKELQVARVYEIRDGAIYHEGCAIHLQKMNDRLNGYRRRDESKMVNRSAIDEPSIDHGWGYNNNNNKSNSKSKRNNENKEKEFVAPTKDEWLNYAKEKYPEMPSIEAEGAWFHYEAKGWIIGRTKAKDWRKCLGTCYVFWRKNKRPTHSPKPQPKKESPDFVAGRAWEPSDYWVKRGYGTHEQWYEAGRPCKSDLEYYEAGLAEWPPHLAKFCKKGNQNGTK